CWADRSRSTAARGAAPRSPSPCRRSDKPAVIRVLLADDHAIVLEGLRALLDGEPDIKVAAWTTDGTEVLKLVQQHKPDVVVLDLDLTPREREVWSLVAAGLTNPQIAERLGLSDNTVKFHVQHLFSKLGVKNRTEAALKYAHGPPRWGLIRT